MDRLSDYIDDETLERLDRSTGKGTALPNAAYTDTGFHELEQRTLFRNSWVFAAFKHRLENSGDMLPVKVAGQPIVLVTDRDGRIRAFHNVCRHRGALLVDGPRYEMASIVCPNHSWSYGLDGKLLARPHFYGGGRHDLNKSENPRADLIELQAGVWYDWVFVNVGGSAVPLTDYLETVTGRLAGYDFGELCFASAEEFSVNANWKLAMENFIEPYHVFSCHPWLNSFVGMEERTPPTWVGHVMFCGYEFRTTDPARGEGLPCFPGLSKTEKRRGDWFVLFPNFAFEVFPDQVAVFVASPQAPDRCNETIALYFIGEGAWGEKYAGARERVVKNWRELNAEDIDIIERMQAGRSSEGFDGGVLSPYWDPVQQHFARVVVESMKE